MKLAELIDWSVFETCWAVFFPSRTGRPASTPRLIAGLLYLQHRKDARLAHEIIVALLHGLTKEQEIELVRDLAQSVADRHGLPVDFAIHGDDPKTWDDSVKGIVGSHAHLLMSTRELTPDGLSKIKGREFIDRKLGPKTLRY